MKPIVAEPVAIEETARRMPKMKLPSSAPVVVTFQMPAVLAKPKVWITALIAVAVILFAVFGGADNSQAVIDAKNAHIESLESLAQTALTQPAAKQAIVHGEFGYVIGLIGGLFLIMACCFIFLAALDFRP